jgi:hypothetical protein
MSDARTTAEASAGEKSSAGFGRFIGRLIVPLLTFAVCCLVAFRIGAFLANRNNAADLATLRTADSAESNPLAATLPLAGMWSFDELNWSIRSEIIPAAEVEAKLASLDATTVKDAATLPDTDADLMGLIEMLRVQPTERDGNQIYRLDRKSMKLQLVTRRIDDRSKTVACAMAYPHDEQNWQLYKFTPRSAVQNGGDVESHLLPLPAGARRTSGRFADDGQAIMELITLETPESDLLATWKQAGWEVRPSGFAGPGEFSYLCARGDEVVYAWSAEEPAAIKNLMLVRTPTPTDTSP